MWVMVLNPDDNSLEEIEVEAYDRFPTEEEARMFTEDGECFLYVHACFSVEHQALTECMLRSLRDTDLRRFGSCPETPHTFDEMTDTDSESWPLQLKYPVTKDGGVTITTKNTTFTPPPCISTFWELLAEFSEIEEWSPSMEGPPEGYKLQWKRIGGSSKASDPWIELADDRDAKQCEADIREFLQTKRKTTNWKLVVQIVAPAKGGSDKRSREDESSGESTGHRKRTKKVAKTTAIMLRCTGLIFTEHESEKDNEPPSRVYRAGEYAGKRGCRECRPYCGSTSM
jgi:hypothetical protein